MALTPGLKLADRYEVVAQIGSGAMGEVYRARDLVLSRSVAVKILPESLSEDDDALSRFDREARALAALSHANILTIHDRGTHEAVSFVVTELLHGETLRARLERGPLSAEEAAAMGACVADGLEGAHQRGVVHRDVKPENIFLTEAGTVKILDFGLARLHGGRIPIERESQATTLVGTQPGTLLGTVGYMAPEQLRGLAADARGDLFALGCVLHEMVTGRRAFQGETVAETIAALLRDDALDPARPPEGVPASLWSTIAWCLEKQPEDRPASAREVAEALRASRDAPVKRTRRRRGGRLAVLPLANEAGAEHDYLVDGVTEGLIGSLSKVPRLKVMARGTVYRYKGRQTDPRSVGRELGVDAVLTGRLELRNSQVHVTTELADARDGSHLFSGDYVSKDDDLCCVHEDVARDVVATLLPSRPPAPKPAPPPHSGSNEAVKLYLRGKYHWYRRPQGTREAIAEFEKALALDPEYALAWAGLADAYTTLGSSGAGNLPASAVMPRAKAAAQRALELDPKLAEAHASLGVVKMHFDWDWGGAEAELLAALALNPGSPAAHHWASHLYTILGRCQDSLRESLAAAELDPLDLSMAIHLAWHYYFSRDFDAAIREANKALELEPSAFWPHHTLGFCHSFKGQHAGAAESQERACEVAPNLALGLAGLGFSYAHAGRRAEAREVLERLLHRAEEMHVPPHAPALVHTALGERDEAFAWLERAFAERSDFLPYLGAEPAFDALRDDPRMRSLLARIAVPVRRA